MSNSFAQRRFSRFFQAPRCQASVAISGTTVVASANTICSNAVDLAPAGRLLQRRGGAGAVADVGHGDLHGVLVHLDVLVAEDLGADHGVLGEVLGHAAADHEQAGGAGLDLDVGQFAEVGDRVEGDLGPPRLIARPGA